MTLQKKRVAAAFLACVLLLTLFPTVGAEPTRTFVVVNDTVLPLNSGMEPIFSGGSMYVPYQLFTQYGLGIFGAYDPNQQYLTLYDANPSRNLTFNLLGGNCFDFTQQYKERAVQQNGKLYVPVSFTGKYFELSVSQPTVSYGTVLRIRQPGKSTDDNSFINNSIANGIFQTRIQEYEAANPPTTSAAGGTTTNAPAAPVRKTVYLTFDDGPNAVTERILDCLDEYDVKATFFLLGQNLSLKRGDTIRRMAASGHVLGLHSYTHDYQSVYGSTEGLLDEFERCNDALYKLTFQRSRVIRLPYGSVPTLNKEKREALQAEGYRYWDWDIDSEDSVKNTSTQHVIDHTISAFGQDKKSLVILFHDKELTLAALPTILEYLISQDVIFATISDNEVPFNYHSDI